MASDDAPCPEAEDYLRDGDMRDAAALPREKPKGRGGEYGQSSERENEHENEERPISRKEGLHTLNSTLPRKRDGDADDSGDEGDDPVPHHDLVGRPAERLEMVVDGRDAEGVSA